MTSMAMERRKDSHPVHDPLMSNGFFEKKIDFDGQMNFDPSDMFRAVFSRFGHGGGFSDMFNFDNFDSRPVNLNNEVSGILKPNLYKSDNYRFCYIFHFKSPSLVARKKSHMTSSLIAMLVREPEFSMVLISKNVITVEDRDKI